MERSEHCWHTFAVAESYPEIYFQRCCCCGAERSAYRRLIGPSGQVLELVGKEPEHDGPLPQGSVACQRKGSPVAEATINPSESAGSP